jgi:hypothetical protein
VVLLQTTTFDLKEERVEIIFFGRGCCLVSLLLLLC